MSANSFTALLGIEAGLLRGLETLRWASESFQRFSEVSAISTVVQCNSSLERPCLKAVVKVSVSIAPEQVIQELVSMEYEYDEKIKVMEPIRCFLLAYDHQVSIAPGVILPHPQMIDHSSWLYCSWEVWRSYRHPVLDLTLDRLLAQTNVTGMEFFSQGKSLVSKNAL